MSMTSSPASGNMFCYMQKGIKITDKIKIANQNGETFLDYLGGPDIITRVLQCGRGGRKGGQKDAG